MRTPTRRDALLAGAGGLSAILAGCVGGDGNSGNGNGNGKGNGNGNGGDPVSVRDVATLDVGSSLAVPYWRRQDEEAVGVVYRYDSSDIQGPDAQALHDSDADVQSFVEATDFETATLLQIGAVGPDTCHNTVDITGFAVEDGTLVGRASTSAPEGQACGSAETHPWVLVRVDFDGTPPENAELTITDGWDDEATVSPTTPAGLDPSELDGHVQPDGDARVLAGSLTCDRERFERHPQHVEEDAVGLGENGRDDRTTFALRADHTEYALGDTVTITMTNVTAEEVITGNRHKYNLQLLTEEGWQDVRGSTEHDHFEYTDEGVSHAPGDGFEWTIELTDEGVIEGHFHEDHFSVCPSLQPGRYRFLYWEPAVAVEFDVEE
jgi:predicted  nucleic acid-binding Zn-ribbon protein